MARAPRRGRAQGGAVTEEVLAGYAAVATAGLAARFDGLSSEAVLAPVLDLLPRAPVCVADIGAGTGRDAAWLASAGHAVLAVEPVAELREAGRAFHGDARIVWLDDRLPALERVTGAFALITLIGVWQHLPDDARDPAMHRLAALAETGGRVILSLRHGPGAPDRPVFPIDPDATVASATRAGLQTIRRVEAASVQPENRANGVRWTWLALQKG